MTLDNSLRDFISDMISHSTQERIAKVGGTDGPALCKFLNNGGAMKLACLELILAEGKAVITSQDAPNFFYNRMVPPGGRPCPFASDRPPAGGAAQ